MFSLYTPFRHFLLNTNANAIHFMLYVFELHTQTRARALLLMWLF